MGSIAPEMSRSIAERGKQRGIRMLDAPVTGNPKVAEAGKVGVMIGGEKETLDHVRPLLEKVSAVIVHAGPSGASSTLKLVNNFIMGVHTGGNDGAAWNRDKLKSLDVISAGLKGSATATAVAAGNHSKP